MKNHKVIPVETKVGEIACLGCGKLVEEVWSWKTPKRQGFGFAVGICALSFFSYFVELSRDRIPEAVFLAVLCITSSGFCAYYDNGNTEKHVEGWRHA